MNINKSAGGASSSGVDECRRLIEGFAPPYMKAISCNDHLKPGKSGSMLSSFIEESFQPIEGRGIVGLVIASLFLAALPLLWFKRGKKNATSVAAINATAAEKIPTITTNGGDKTVCTTDSEFVAFLDLLGKSSSAPDGESNPQPNPPAEVTFTRNDVLKCSKCDDTVAMKQPLQSMASLLASPSEGNQPFHNMLFGLGDDETESSGISLDATAPLLLPTLGTEESQSFHDVLFGLGEYNCLSCIGCGAHKQSDNSHRFLQWCEICEEDYCVACFRESSCDECGLDFVCGGCVVTCAQCNTDLCRRCSAIKECGDCKLEICNDCRYAKGRKDCDNACLGCLNICSEHIFPKLIQEKDQLREENQKLHLEIEELRGEVDILRSKTFSPNFNKRTKLRRNLFLGQSLPQSKAKGRGKSESSSANKNN